MRRDSALPVSKHAFRSFRALPPADRKVALRIAILQPTIAWALNLFGFDRVFLALLAWAERTRTGAMPDAAAYSRQVRIAIETTCQRRDCVYQASQQRHLCARPDTPCSRFLGVRTWFTKALKQ